MGEVNDSMSTKSDNPPPLSFQDDSSAISPLSTQQTPTPHDFNQPRKRYVARIKNVCIAIPFNPNETLSSFQKEAILRASSHRKLRNELKLSSRLQYIKLSTPHYSQLVDCSPQDALCEIAGEEDMIIFQTQSDDENETEEIPKYKSQPIKITKQKKQKRKSSSNISSKSAMHSTAWNKSSNSIKMTKRMSQKKNKSKEKSQNLSADLDQSTTKSIVDDMDLKDNEDSDESVRSGYSQNSDDEHLNLSLIEDKKNKTKKQKHHIAKSHDVEAFAKELMNVKKTTNKREYDSKRGRHKDRKS